MAALHYALICEIRWIPFNSILTTSGVYDLRLNNKTAVETKQLKSNPTSTLRHNYLGGSSLELLEIYVLNLAVTLAMFIVLIFRAWIEFKNYRIMWKELEWRRTYEVVGRVLKAEKDMFTGVEGGEELYNLLCEMFKVEP